jgi:hypothetical protein
MNTSEIILAIDAEIKQLQKARDLWGADVPVTRGSGRLAGKSSSKTAQLTQEPKKRGSMTPEGRAGCSCAKRQEESR